MLDPRLLGKIYFQQACFYFEEGEKMSYKYMRIQGREDSYITRYPKGIFSLLVLSQYSGHRKCDFYAAPSA